ncbi:putative ribonuclease H-like domain-containing protein [Tanacetum coccineum]
MYYKIIRRDGSSKNYKILSEMLYDFDRQDIVELYRLVKERYSSSKPEGYDLMLWGDLYTLFEPDEESEIWMNQNEYNLISLGSTSGIRACALRNFDLEVMELENTQNNALAKLPMLKLGEYEMWEIRIKQYFQIQDYALWEVIENGNSWVPIPVTTPSETGTSTATKMTVPSTIEEKTCKKNDVKARSLLLMALPNEHQLTFDQYVDAQSMFAAIKARFGGNEATKKTQKALLKQQYENFSASSSESLDSIFNRLQRLVSRLAILGVVTPPEDLNVKFLRSLPSEWDTHVVVWMNKPDFDTMGLDDLYNNFKIVEQKVKKSAGASNDDKNLAFLTTSGASSTNNINTVNPEVSTATTKVNTASTEISTASFSDATVYAFLSTQPQGSQLVHEDLEQLHDDDLEEMDLKWNMALLSMRARKFYQRTGRKIIIDGSNTAGYDKSKVECFNCHKMGHFARECRAPRSKDKQKLDSMCSSKAVTDKSKKGFGYNAVPSPHPLILNRPTPLDLSYSGLEEFKQPKVNEYGPRDSSVKPTTGCDKEQGLEKNSFLSPIQVREEEPKKARENNDAPIIEDWVSDDEDDVEPIPKVEKKTVIPTATKKEFVKPEKPVRRSGLVMACGPQRKTNFISFGVTEQISSVNDMICVSGCSQGTCLGKAIMPIFQISKTLIEVMLLLVEEQMGGMNYSKVPKDGLTCLVAKATSEESMLWHRRLGHVNFKNINKLVKENLYIPSQTSSRILTELYCNAKFGRMLDYFDDVSPSSVADAQIHDQMGYMMRCETERLLMILAVSRNNGMLINTVYTARQKLILSSMRSASTTLSEDHPIEHVIGDVQSSVQTRRMKTSYSKKGFLSAIYEGKSHQDLFYHDLFENFFSSNCKRFWYLVDLPKGHRAIRTMMKSFAPLWPELRHRYSLLASYWGFLWSTKWMSKVLSCMGQIEEEGPTGTEDLEKLWPDIMFAVCACAWFQVSSTVFPYLSFEYLDSDYAERYTRWKFKLEVVSFWLLWKGYLIQIQMMVYGYNFIDLPVIYIDNTSTICNN